MCASRIYSVIGLGASLFIFISHFYINNILIRSFSLFFCFGLTFIFVCYAFLETKNSSAEKLFAKIVFILSIASVVAYYLLVRDIGFGSILIIRKNIFFYISYFVTAALLVSNIILTIVMFFIRP